MDIYISSRKRASFVGILILVAYSMLAYTITNNKILGVITDIISGLAVIGIPLLLYPFFNHDKNKTINYGYLIFRLFEGVLMIIGGVFIVIPSLADYREIIYNDIHIYFFIAGALLLYVLLYRTQLIPRFISIWGFLAAIILLVITIVKLFGVDSAILDALLAPIILNEIFLAIWLMLKGFKKNTMQPSADL